MPTIHNGPSVSLRIEHQWRAAACRRYAMNAARDGRRYWADARTIKWQRDSNVSEARLRLAMAGAFLPAPLPN